MTKQMSMSDHIRTELQAAFIDVSGVKCTGNSVVVNLNTPPSDKALPLYESAAKIIVRDMAGSNKVVTVNTNYSVAPKCEPLEWRNRHIASIMYRNMENIMSRMVRTILQNTIDAYPWKTRSFMIAFVDPLVIRSVESLRKGRLDPLIHGCVDSILPDPNTILNNERLIRIAGEIHRLYGYTPASRMQLYEGLYLLVTRSDASEDAERLFDAVFDLLDTLLEDGDI